MDTIAKLIFEARNRRGLLQAELGEALGLKAAAHTVRQWEKGNSVPDDELIPEIAGLLGLNAARLYRLKKRGKKIAPFIIAEAEAEYVAIRQYVEALPKEMRADCIKDIRGVLEHWLANSEQKERQGREK